MNVYTYKVVVVISWLRSKSNVMIFIFIYETMIINDTLIPTNPWIINSTHGLLICQIALLCSVSNQLVR